jgi:hypothetical protein
MAKDKHDNLGELPKFQKIKKADGRGETDLKRYKKNKSSYARRSSTARVVSKHNSDD